MYSKIQEQIIELRSKIIENDKLYGEGNPILSDSEYDKLYYELLELERKYPEFYSKESPTQKIYTMEKLSTNQKIKHPEPMLSMDKATTIEQVKKFVDNMRKVIKENGITNTKLIMTKKYDGLTVVVKYNETILKQGVTRGDGYFGSDCSIAMLNTQNLPKKIDFKEELEFRGEGIIPYADYERINIDGKYKGIRNLAAGTIASLKGSIAKERNLQIHGFQLIKAGDKVFTSFIEQMEFMKNLGIPTGNYETYDIVSDYEVDRLIQDILEYNENVRPCLSYQIDGLILEMDDLKLRNILGYTSKFPRWALAYKFPAIDATTKLINVEWTIGKTGQCTPKAIIEPVDLDGATISQASLANLDNIRRREIKLYDTVLVAKAHDVIPQIVSPIKEARTGEEVEIIPPKVCPSCGETLVWEGANLKCINGDCQAQLNRKIRQFCSKGAMNIEGLGNKAVDIFLERKLISCISDIFLLKYKIEAMQNLEKFGDKKIEKLIKAIEISKTAPLSKVLFGLTIKNVGEKAAKDIAKKYKTMDTILEISKDKTIFYNSLLEINDLGNESANSIIDYFNDDANIALIKELQLFGLTMVEETVIVENNIFECKIVVVTGTLDNFGRTEIKEKLESLGAKVTNSVSKKTDYVLVGKDAGSKYDKAVELGIRIINEIQFLEMINN